MICQRLLVYHLQSKGNGTEKLVQKYRVTENDSPETEEISLFNFSYFFFSPIILYSCL